MARHGTANSETLNSVAKLVATVLTVAVLYFARDIFVPLALALLLAFLLSPLVNRLQRCGVSNKLAVIVTALMAFALLGGGLTLVGRELTILFADLPSYKGELVAKVKSVSGLGNVVSDSWSKLGEEMTEAMSDNKSSGKSSNLPRNEMDERSTAPSIDQSNSDESNSDESNSDESNSQPEGMAQLSVLTSKLFGTMTAIKTEKTNDGKSPDTPIYTTEVRRAPLSVASWAGTVGSVLGPLGTAGLVTVFALFMLIHRDDLRDRVISVVSRGNYVTTTEALDEVGQRISRYLIAQSIVNSLYGFVLTVGLFTIGHFLGPDGVFPSVVLWGALATCLRFVPYVGPIVAAVFPLSIAIAVFPGFSVFLMVLFLIVTLELLSNNVLEPWLYGASTGISPIAIIIAAVVWGWMWGPVGLLLSTPLTVCLVVLGRHVRQFRIFSTLLGEEIEIKPSLRLYQRLLAGDEMRARELLRSYNAEHGTSVTCDEMVIPALKRMIVDQSSDALSNGDGDEMLQMLMQLSTDKIDWNTVDKDVDNTNSNKALADSGGQPLSSVIGCAAHYYGEEIVLDVLRKSLHKVCELTIMQQNMMPSDVVDRIATERPQLVVIAVVPLGGFAQARYLCQEIRREGYKGPIIVACFGKFKQFDKLLVRFRKAGATFMATSFHQTRTKIERLIAERPHPVASKLRVPDIHEGIVTSVS
ncbi:MAG: AI-2E family transporter [Pirellulaceae bacterium]|nr:AI-2E family transporter [Pirellulaceae bacterium]